MFKWLKESLDTGTATVAYPFAPMQLTADMRGKPVHDAVECIACGACATACPANAIQMQLDLKAKEIVWVIDYGRCIFCGRCEEVCPTSAMILTQEFELAVMSKPDLVEEARYSLQCCSSCNKPYAPRKEIDYLARLMAREQLEDDQEQNLARELLSVCPGCKRIEEGTQIQEFYGLQKGGK